MPDSKPDYLLRFRHRPREATETRPGTYPIPEDVIMLRALLKRLLRSYGFELVDVEQTPPREV